MTERTDFPYPAFAPGTCLECEAVVNFFFTTGADTDPAEFALRLGAWHGVGHPGGRSP